MLPPAFESLFADSRSGSFFRTRSWLEVFSRYGVDAGDRFRLYAVDADGAPLALLPAVVSRLYRAHPRARVLHFIQPEAEPYLPLLAPDHPDFARILEGLIESIRAERRPCDVLRVSPLDPASPFAHELILSLRRLGYLVQLYRHLDDRYEQTEGMSATAYLAARPGALAATLRGKGQPSFDSGRCRFRLIRDASDVDVGNEAYQIVLETSPGEAEIEPAGYVRNLMRAAADAGALRLGLIFFDGEPAAVQLWIVSAGVARCIRIWNDPAHADLPLDDMLTERLVVHLLDSDGVRELDFGSLASEAAQNWAPQARQRVGVIAFNPRTWRGIKGAVRHIAIPKLLSLPRRIRRRLKRRKAWR